MDNLGVTIGRSTWRWASRLGAAALCSAGATAGGAPDTTIAALAAAPSMRVGPTQPIGERTPEWLEARIAELDSADLVTREKAQDELAGDRGVSLAMLEARLADAAPERGLTAEQHARLSRVARDRFERTPRGALGVSFGSVESGTGVSIGATYDGFDSRRVLRPGDVVTAIDGKSVLTQRECRSAILSHEPGEMIALDLIRRGERMTVTVTLGDYSNLRGGGLDGPSMSQAWDERCRRLKIGAEPATIEPALGPDRWMALALHEHERVNTVVDAMKRGDEPAPSNNEPVLAAGGVIRPGMGDSTFVLSGDPNARDIERMQAFINSKANEIERLRMRVSQERDAATRERFRMQLANQIQEFQQAQQKLMQMQVQRATPRIHRQRLNP